MRDWNSSQSYEALWDFLKESIVRVRREFKPRTKMAPKSCPPMGSNPMCIGPDRYESLYHSQVQSFLSETLHHHTRERKEKEKKKKKQDALTWLENFPPSLLNQVGLIGFCNNWTSFSSSNVCCCFCCCCSVSSIGPNAKITGSPRPAEDGSDTHPKLSSTGLLINLKHLCIGSPLLHCLAANLSWSSFKFANRLRNWLRTFLCICVFSSIEFSRVKVPGQADECRLPHRVPSCPLTLPSQLFVSDMTEFVSHIEGIGTHHIWSLRSGLRILDEVLMSL